MSRQKIGDRLAEVVRQFDSGDAPAPRPSSASLRAAAETLEQIRDVIAAGGSFPVSAVQKDALSMAARTVARYADHVERKSR